LLGDAPTLGSVRPAGYRKWRSSGLFDGQAGEVTVVHIVVCDDVDGGIRNSGELARLEVLGNVTVYNDVAETRPLLLERPG
jgi:hypothetical protein